MPVITATNLRPTGSKSTQAAQPTDTRYLPGGAYSQWCPGLVNAYNAQADNFIEAGLIWPYVNKLDVYRCPADTKVFMFATIQQPQPRGFSMNCCMNPIQPYVNWNNPSTVYVFYKDTDFIQPGPSLTWVLIDENEGSINDTLFCAGPTDPNHWQDAPATRHGDAGGISFADGHSEIKKWTDQYLLMKPTIFASGSGHASDPNSSDNAWLEKEQQHKITRFVTLMRQSRKFFLGADSGLFVNRTIYVRRM